MAEAATEAPKKSGGLVWIILAAVVLAAAGGGGAAFYFAKSQNSAEVSADDEDADAADTHPGKGKKKAKAPAQYIKLDPPFVVNFEAKGMMRFLQVQVELMSRDPATIDLLKLHDPVIRNNLLMLLGSQPYESISTREGKERLRVDALKTVGDVVSAEGGKAERVEQLYFTSFVMQ